MTNQSPCPVQAECGGCPLMTLSRPDQAKWKRDLVLDALRARGLSAPPEVELVAVGDGLAYRNRLRLKVNEQGRVVFFNPQKITDCAVVMDSLRVVIQELVQVSHGRPELLQGVEHLEVRAPDEDGFAGLVLHGVPTNASALSALSSALGDSILIETPEHTEVRSRKTQRFTLSHSLDMEVPLGSFMQVNHSVNRALIAHVVAFAANRQPRTVLDLYCGAGNYSLPLAELGAALLGIEFDAASVRAAQRAADRQGIHRAKFAAGDAHQLASDLVRDGQLFDLVIANPPRAGLKAAVGPVARLAERGIVLIACSPEALAKDVGALHDLGWKLDGLTLFDMFPNTRHVESVATLSPASTV